MLVHPDANTDGAQNARWVWGAWQVGAVQRDASPECHIEILLPPQTERRDVMNAPSCFRHKRSHRFLQHVRHHLTQMRLRDGSSFFPLISFTRFFSLFSRCQRSWHKAIIHSRSGGRTEILLRTSNLLENLKNHLLLLTKMPSVSTLRLDAPGPVLPAVV